MEVSLLEAEGLPQGCLLSVSSGGVRRQAPATREKCRLAFPATATRGEGIRIEALEVVAGAKLPLQAGVEKYNLDLKGGKGYPARVSLLVRDLALSSVGSDSSDLVKGLHPPTPRGSGSRRHLAALSARRYLEDKGLLQWVQGLFQELVRERPEDPWPYVDKHSRELFELGGEETEGALDEEAPQSSPEEATAPEEWVPGARAPEEAPELEAPLPSANRAGTGQLKGVTAANIEAAISGAPPHVLHELLLKLSAQPPSADEATTASDGAKEELRVLLAKACQDGSLHNALHTAMGVEPQAGALTPQAPRTPTEGKRSWRKAPGRVSPPVSVASLPKAGEGEASSSSQAADSRRSAPALSSGLSGLDLEQLRQKARRRIEAASLSRPGSQHRLERSPSEINETQEPSKQDCASRPLCSRTSTLSLPATNPSQAGKAEGAEEDAPSLSINELRAKAYFELTTAVQEQRLSPEALGFGPPSMGQLKERALSELIAAAQDGSLDAEILELTAHQGEFASSSSGRRSIKVLQPPLVAQEDQCTPRGTRKPLEAWAPGSLAEPRGRRPLEVTSPPPLAPSTEEEDDDDEQVLELRAGTENPPKKRSLSTTQDRAEPLRDSAHARCPSLEATAPGAAETLRLRARACLARGAESGALGASLQAASAVHTSALRLQGRAWLVASAQAGTLRQELEAAPAGSFEGDEVAQVQRRMEFCLSEAARSGALAAALEDCGMSTPDIGETPVMVQEQAEQGAQNSCEPADALEAPGSGQGQDHSPAVVSVSSHLVTSGLESSAGGPSTLDPNAEDQDGSTHPGLQASQSPNSRAEPPHPDVLPQAPASAELPPGEGEGDEGGEPARGAETPIPDEHSAAAVSTSALPGQPLADQPVVDEGATARGAASPGDAGQGAEQESARPQERPALAVVGRRNLGPRSLRELASREVEDLRAKLALAGPGAAEAVGSSQQVSCGVEQARMLHSVTSAGEGSSVVV